MEFAIQLLGALKELAILTINYNYHQLYLNGMSALASNLSAYVCITYVALALFSAVSRATSYERHMQDFRDRLSIGTSGGLSDSECEKTYRKLMEIVDEHLKK